MKLPNPQDIARAREIIANHAKPLSKTAGAFLDSRMPGIMSAAWYSRPAFAGESGRRPVFVVRFGKN